MGIKVCKFGGTSMADKNSLIQVANIIKSDLDRKYVVVSAPGKRNKEDKKITDLLYACADSVIKNGDVDKSFSLIEERFVEIATELNLNIDIKSILNETKEDIKNNASNKDFVASRGEYLSARVISNFLGYEFVDAKDIIFFKDNGLLDAVKTAKATAKKLKNIEYAVIPGFYGLDKNGKIKTFSRGGSDITGSIIAGAVNANLYENWTDVNGFLTVDPRIVDNPKQIKELSYKELRELSYMGATVLHSDSIFPVRKADIPINIKNTFCPENAGTMIVPTSKHIPSGNIVTGIAGKKDFTVIFIHKSMMNAELGFAKKVLGVLESFNLSIEHMPTGIDTLSVVIESKDLKGEKLQQVVDKIKKVVSPDLINVLENIALIATVGHGMNSTKGTAYRLFKSLYEADVNVVLIDQGSSELNIIVGVLNEDYEKSVKAIYNEFILD